MLHQSDNTIAEVLTRVLAVHDGRRAVPSEAMLSVRAALGELGLDITGLELYDGAGFSVRNRIPPRVLTEGLRAAALAEQTRELPGWLAEAGLTGTLDDRYTSSPGAGVVRAKTGSLTGVTALSGIVFTAEGRPLVFSVLADGMPYGQDRPQAAIDAFANALAQCGCRE
jgi:D-alanyl-D-alanine carboxypeptidase/D-alanyl-D-alanine-endopeptidase (penicillin-binding protein 4)